MDRHPPDDRPIKTEICANLRRLQDRPSVNSVSGLPCPPCLLIACRECRFRFYQGVVLPWFDLERMTTGLFMPVMDQAAAAVRK